MALSGESIARRADALQVGGNNFGPYALTNGAFSGPITAPAVPSTVTGAPYPITVTYLPDTTAYSNPSPPYTTPLNVSPATTTITEAVNPASTGAGSPVVVSGSVTGSNGATPVGNVNIAVCAALILHIVASRCYSSSQTLHWIVERWCAGFVTSLHSICQGDKGSRCKCSLHGWRSEENMKGCASSASHRLKTFCLPMCR